MPKLDLSKLPLVTGSRYPGALNALMDKRSVQRLGDAAGLTQYGVNLVFLEPGGLSSLRHYHMEQDEFVMVTQGVCTLIDDNGATEMQVGDCAAFKAGDPNPHHLVNQTDEPAAFLVIGTHTKTETAIFGDIDMKMTFSGGDIKTTRKDGSALSADQIGDSE